MSKSSSFLPLPVMNAADAPIEVPKKSPLLIVISGPSGVGKDSIIHRLAQRNPALHFVVTTTSRSPRPEEREGVDYFFVSVTEFKNMIARNELLEHAWVYNDYKGISKSQIKKALDSGKDVLLRVDVQGSATVRSLCPDALLIFITPRTEVELIQRLTERESESSEELKLRIETARQEMQRMEEFDYVVINSHGQMDEAVDNIEAIIRAEHLRVHPRKICL
jgi:guanylate kinase